MAPLTREQIAAYKQRVKDKTFPLRVRYLCEWLAKLILWATVIGFLAFGATYVWILLYTKNKADNIEKRLHNFIEETKRSSYQD